MKPSVLFKIASVLLYFFGLTHTFGLFRPRTGEGVSTVLAFMRTVHFDVMGSSRSFWDFYAGFGLLLTVFLWFSAVLAWQLGGLVREHPRLARTLAWPFALSQVAVAVLGWTNFFLAPIIVSTAVACCLVLAAWLSGR
jgi:hypothetical protein